MSITTRIRTTFSPALRRKMRSNPVIRKLLKLSVRKDQVRPHPRAPYQLHFDGHRNMGWAFGSLKDEEQIYFDCAADLIEQIQPQTVWDIGANIGLWSLFLCGLQPPIKHVIAFEPDEFNLALLKRNQSSNAIDRLTIMDVALSDQEGTATFNRDLVTGSTGSLETENLFVDRLYGIKPTAAQVKISTVDALLNAGHPAPQFLKIDVEGHEHSLLRGASKLLAEVRPCMLIEMTGDHREQTFRLLTDAGYHLFDAASRAMIHSPAFEAAAIPRERTTELGF